MKSKYSDSQRKERRKAKHEKRKARAYKRRGKRMEDYKEKRLNGRPRYSSWRDPNSPTGYSQYCCYQPGWGDSICQSPCNGDC